MVEDFPGIGKAIIHEHEEIAEKLAIVLYLLSGISILGLILNVQKHSKAKFISFVAVVVAVLGVYLAILVGTSGGEIRHTEIREESVINVANDTNSNESESNITRDEK